MVYYVRKITYIVREWLSGGVPPSQGEGRGFESRLALILSQKSWIIQDF